jgi:dTDP-glucose 4,6-dehydratase/UDP-glucuronate decarboxylase
MLANSEGTRRLLDLALAHGGRFLYTSTSEIYGDPLLHPQREDYRGNVSSIGPRAMYDESKRYGEAMTMTYVRSRGADGRIVRIFNTYGPRADLNDGRVIVNFIKQALRGESMTIYGDGLQTRSMCFVDDLIDALIRCMESPHTRGEVLNLGNPEEHTVMEIAELVRRLTRSASAFVFTAPAVGDDPRLRCPDIGKARSMLSWAPSTSLETGLNRVIREMIAMYNGELVPHANGAAPANGALPHAANGSAPANGELVPHAANGSAPTRRGTAARRQRVRAGPGVDRGPHPAGRYRRASR